MICRTLTNEGLRHPCPLTLTYNLSWSVGVYCYGKQHLDPSTLLLYFYTCLGSEKHILLSACPSVRMNESMKYYILKYSVRHNRNAYLEWSCEIWNIYSCWKYRHFIVDIAAPIGDVGNREICYSFEARALK